MSVESGALETVVDVRDGVLTSFELETEVITIRDETVPVKEASEFVCDGRACILTEGVSDAGEVLVLVDLLLCLVVSREE